MVKRGYVLGAWVGCAAASVVLGRAAPASACSFAAYGVPVRLEGMEYIPGNLVYFEVAVEDPGLMSLRTEAGAPIPASVREIGGTRVFAPDEPIAPGTSVVLEYDWNCYRGCESENEGPARPGQEFAFQTYEHLPLTLQPGVLWVEEHGVEMYGYEPIMTFGFVRARLRSPSVEGSAEHLMSHVLYIDGEVWDSFGFVGSNWTVKVASFCGPGQRWQEVNRDSCGGVSAVPVGHHTLEVHTRVAGYEGEIAPITLDIETTCSSEDDPRPTENSALPSESCSLPPGGASSKTAGAALGVVGLLGLLALSRRSVSPKKH
jgi:hypothetical protein